MLESADFWGRVAQIIFATIFSVALVWVVIRIWNADDNPDNKPDEKK